MSYWIVIIIVARFAMAKRLAVRTLTSAWTEGTGLVPHVHRRVGAVVNSEFWFSFFKIFCRVGSPDYAGPRQIKKVDTAGTESNLLVCLSI
jgi:hypothetical protein